MPKGKGREGNRKDIWLTERDILYVQLVMQLMKDAGIEPARQGKYTISQVVRFALDYVVKNS